MHPEQDAGAGGRARISIRPAALIQLSVHSDLLVDLAGERFHVRT